jgi:cysteine desulfurase family protein (TIGR01976 family)
MTDAAIDLSPLRAHFPALQETDDQGRPFVFFDGPAGTQVPQAVIDAVAHHYANANSLAGGNFIVSQRCAVTVQQAREAMADFLNAPASNEIVFGPNMTTLTYNISRAIGRTLKPGDEIVVTWLDHYANVSSWMALEEQGIQVKQARFDVETFRLDLDHLTSLLTESTKIVAVGFASNAIGTINPISKIAAMAHNVGAKLYVDAVHYAPHGPIDVQALGCDMLVCSVYKFFGPHVGVLWGKGDFLETLPAYQVKPAKNSIPYKFETGMLNFEGLAGATAAINYLADIGRNYGEQFTADTTRYNDRRRSLKQGMLAISRYERELAVYLVEQLQTISGLTIYGITDPDEFGERCPTVSFTMSGHSPAELSAYLGEQNIFVWDGNNYALGVTEQLGNENSGGMVRVGLAHYNIKEDIDRLISALSAL